MSAANDLAAVCLSSHWSWKSTTWRWVFLYRPHIWLNFMTLPFVFLTQHHSPLGNNSDNPLSTSCGPALQWTLHVYYCQWLLGSTRKISFLIERLKMWTDDVGWGWEWGASVQSLGRGVGRMGAPASLSHKPNWCSSLAWETFLSAVINPLGNKILYQSINQSHLKWWLPLLVLLLTDGL